MNATRNISHEILNAVADKLPNFRVFRSGYGKELIGDYIVEKYEDYIEQVKDNVEQIKEQREQARKAQLVEIANQKMIQTVDKILDKAANNIGNV